MLCEFGARSEQGLTEKKKSRLLAVHGLSSISSLRHGSELCLLLPSLLYGHVQYEEVFRRCLEPRTFCASHFGHVVAKLLWFADLFIALDASEEDLRNAAEEAFRSILLWVSPTCWNLPNWAWHLFSEKKQKIDAVARAHSEPVSSLAADGEESRLPAETYFEAFHEKLYDGRLTPEVLARTLSLCGREQARNEQARRSKDVGTSLGQHFVHTSKETLHVIDAVWIGRVASNVRRD